MLGSVLIKLREFKLVSNQLKLDVIISKLLIQQKISKHTYDKIENSLCPQLLLEIYFGMINV
jgi:hypothetical protein